MVRAGGLADADAEASAPTVTPAGSVAMACRTRSLVGSARQPNQRAYAVAPSSPFMIMYTSIQHGSEAAAASWRRERHGHPATAAGNRVSERAVTWWTVHALVGWPFPVVPALVAVALLDDVPTVAFVGLGLLLVVAVVHTAVMPRWRFRGTAGRPPATRSTPRPGG